MLIRSKTNLGQYTVEMIKQVNEKPGPTDAGSGREIEECELGAAVLLHENTLLKMCLILN